MSYSGEQTFRAAVIVAEGVRQQSKSAAMTTYAFDPSALATYQTAIADADVAYFTAVNTAFNALNEATGNVGMNGPIPGAGWTPMLLIA